MEKKRNLWVIPTDKPSRLFKNKESNLYSFRKFEDEPLNSNIQNQHTYITNSEKIKDDEWHLHYYEGQPVISKSHNGASEYINLKAKEFGYNKIILTTDSQLIQDGIQAIDDEFLEWFVKNPSCESVETVKVPYHNESGYSYLLGIPREEPKQDAINYSLNAFKVPKEYFGKEEPNYNMKQEIFDEMKKQETLEEVAKKYASKIWDYSDSNEKTLHANCKKAFIKGAKWQQKNRYSEEEVLEILREFYKVASLKDFPLVTTIPLWFEQFKNK